MLQITQPYSTTHAFIGSFGSLEGFRHGGSDLEVVELLAFCCSLYEMLVALLIYSFRGVLTGKEECCRCRIGTKRCNIQRFSRINEEESLKCCQRGRSGEGDPAHQSSLRYLPAGNSTRFIQLLLFVKF